MSFDEEARSMTMEEFKELLQGAAEIEPSPDPTPWIIHPDEYKRLKEEGKL